MRSPRVPCSGTTRPFHCLLYFPCHPEPDRFTLAGCARPTHPLYSARVSQSSPSSPSPFTPLSSRTRASNSAWQAGTRPAGSTSTTTAGPISASEGRFTATRRAENSWKSPTPEPAWQPTSIMTVFSISTPGAGARFTATRAARSLLPLNCPNYPKAARWGPVGATSTGTGLSISMPVATSPGLMTPMPTSC